MKEVGSLDQQTTTAAATNTLTLPDLSLNNILQQTQPSTFRRVLGGVVGTAANIAAPGIGGVVGNLISGGTNSLVTGLAGGLASGNSDPSQFLQLQQQMEQQQEAYETLSNVLKARHDAAMAAIQNIH